MIQKNNLLHNYIIRTSELIGEIPNLLDWNLLKFDSELSQQKISEKGTDFISKSCKKKLIRINQNFKLLLSYWLKFKF